MNKFRYSRKVLFFKILRDEINSVEDVLPWPPRPKDLSPETYQLPKLTELFFKSILTGNFTADNSARVARLTLSFAQDIIYAVSFGKIKTPKCLLLPHTIKTLTNNTELVNLICKLGHGASYTLIEELDTENAFKMVEKQQQNEVILPDGVQKEVFTLVVADNIDRQEETLSGKSIFKAFDLFKFRYILVFESHLIKCFTF